MESIAEKRQLSERQQQVSVPPLPALPITSPYITPLEGVLYCRRPFAGQRDLDDRPTPHPATHQTFSP